MKFIVLAVALVLSTSAMAGSTGGGEGGDKVFERMYQANQAAIARQQ